MESQISSEISEQDQSTLEEKNNVEMDTNDEKRKNKEQEDDSEIQTKTGEISVFDQYKPTI